MLRYFQEYDGHTSSWAKELGNTDSETSTADDQEAAYGSQDGFWTEVYKVLRELFVAQRGDNADAGYENELENDDDYDQEEENHVDDGETDDDESIVYSHINRENLKAEGEDSQVARNNIAENEGNFPYDEAYYFRPLYNEKSLAEDRTPALFVSNPKQKSDIGDGRNASVNGNHGRAPRHKTIGDGIDEDSDDHEDNGNSLGPENTNVDENGEFVFSRASQADLNYTANPQNITGDTDKEFWVQVAAPVNSHGNEFGKTMDAFHYEDAAGKNEGAEKDDPEDDTKPEEADLDDRDDDDDESEEAELWDPDDDDESEEAELWDPDDDDDDESEGAELWDPNDDDDESEGAELWDPDDDDDESEGAELWDPEDDDESKEAKLWDPDDDESEGAELRDPDDDDESEGAELWDPEDDDESEQAKLWDPDDDESEEAEVGDHDDDESEEAEVGDRDDDDDDESEEAELWDRDGEDESEEAELGDPDDNKAKDAESNDYYVGDDETNNKEDSSGHDAEVLSEPDNDSITHSSRSK